MQPGQGQRVGQNTPEPPGFETPRSNGNGQYGKLCFGLVCAGRRKDFGGSLVRAFFLFIRRIRANGQPDFASEE